MESLDPNVCPSCGASASIQELATRVTWQPLTLHWSDPGEDGKRALEELDYHEWDYGDDVEVTGYQCRECLHEWTSLAHLQEAMIESPFPGDDGSNLVVATLTDRGADYDEVVKAIRGNGGDLWLDFFGPAMDRIAETLNVEVDL